MLAAIDLGLIFGIMALGVYISYRILDFADLTVDGSFVTGGALAAIGILNGYSPWLCTLAGFLAGCAAGVITGLLHTMGGINPLLAGILTQTGLYSINLRIMSKANLSLLRQPSILAPLKDGGHFASPVSIIVFAIAVALIAAALIWFLTTDFGLGLQATGNNLKMANAEGVATKFYTVLGLALSNGLVALSGAIMAQYQGFADIGMGIGIVVAGLASVILGQAVLAQRPVWVGALAAIVGSVLYRLIIQLALNAGFNPNDMKLISAVLVIAALVLPNLKVFRSARKRKDREEARAAIDAELEHPTLQGTRRQP